MQLRRSWLLAGWLAVGGCHSEFECADACAKVYAECGTALEVSGVTLPRSQCELVCEEGLGTPDAGVSLWIDCVHDTVCPGEVADDDARDLHRYDVTWCTPIFVQFTKAM